MTSQTQCRQFSIVQCERGVPVRCWTFAGNTADTAIIRTVKDDLAGWSLRRLVRVADRGLASAASQLQQSAEQRQSVMLCGGPFVSPRVTG
jgi:hypothetical protein